MNRFTADRALIEQNTPVEYFDSGGSASASTDLENLAKAPGASNFIKAAGEAVEEDAEEKRMELVREAEKEELKMKEDIEEEKEEPEQRVTQQIWASA